MIFSYFLISLVAILGHGDSFLGSMLFNRPIILGTLVGIILSDVQQGIIIGATLELVFMGNMSIGASLPPDIVTSGVLGTFFAIRSGQGPSVALAIALPISILGEMIISGIFVLRPILMKKFYAFAETGDYKSFEKLHLISGLSKPLLMGIITFLTLLLGADAMKNFLESLPAWINSGLQIAGKMLPALGFALLLSVMLNKYVIPFFFLGFILSTFLKLPVLAIGGLGIITAMIITGMTKKESPSIQNEDDEFTTKDTNTSSKEGNTFKLINKKDIRKMTFRSLALEANFNFETWQNTGFIFSIIPILKKLYTSKERMAKALKRHLQLFNTNPHGSTFIMGLSAAMEEQNSQQKDFDVNTINHVKTALMGSLAGVFDSLFWGTLRVIAAGVGTSLALEGNILGPILFFLIFNIPHLLVRYNLSFIGYKTGNVFLKNLTTNNAMDNLKYGASIMGLMVVGAMTASLIKVNTPLAIKVGTSTVALQNILDSIAPSLIPLILTFSIFALLKKGIKTTYLLLGLVVFGFLCSVLNIFS